MGWGGGERLKLGGKGGGNNVDLLKTKSLILGFERLNSPSRLRKCLDLRVVYREGKFLCT